MTSDQINQVINSSIAVATFLAAFVALFGERFWNWISRPKIHISFDRNSERCFRWADVPLCNIQEEGQKPNVRKYYFRLKITNNGNTATKLRVRADILDKYGKPVDRFEPSTLQWISGREEEDLVNGESEYVNLLSQVVNHPEINHRLTIEIFNTSPRGIAWDRILDKYKYSITVFGANIKPVSITAMFIPNRDKLLPGRLILS